MLPTRIHERYLFPAFSVMTLLIPFVKRMRLIYAILTGTYLINLAYVMELLNSDTFISYGDPVVIAVGFINLIVLKYVLILTWRALKGVERLSSRSIETSVQQA
jgi:hypothetical protein